jgi:hypothetical protein
MHAISAGVVFCNSGIVLTVDAYKAVIAAGIKAFFHLDIPHRGLIAANGTFLTE